VILKKNPTIRRGEITFEKQTNLDLGENVVDRKRRLSGVRDLPWISEAIRSNCAQLCQRSGRAIFRIAGENKLFDAGGRTRNGAA
jgi:hypothetical protein